MVSSQLHYIKRVVFMPFLLAKILNYQGSTHFIGVGSLSHIIYLCLPQCLVLLIPNDL